MNTTIPNYGDLAFVFLILLSLGAYLCTVSRKDGLGVLKAAFRMVLQLGAVGFVLRYAMSADSALIVGIMVLIMLFAASWEVFARQRKGKVIDILISGILPLIGVSCLFTLFSLYVCLNVSPWYDVKVVVPLLGMILGNTLTCIAVTISLVHHGIEENAAKIESRLALGETSQQAVFDIKKQALVVGLMIPLTNMLASSGIIILPGVMTGQILGGFNPIVAAKYQVFITLLIGCSSAAGASLAARIATQRMFDDRHRLMARDLPKSKLLNFVGQG